MYLFLWTLSVSLFFIAATSQAALTIPGANGTDGGLHITADTTIDLGAAPGGTWDDPSSPSGSNGSNAGNGVYDPTQWAVVFKYSSVTVDAGATLTFLNHPSRAPVVWLVTGNVSIDGTVDLDGATGALAPGLAEPGPGGFRGGMATYTAGVTQSSGFGPGGAGGDGNEGYGASYGAQGNGGPASYGNPSLVPLIGGSGGGGDNDNNSAGGAGGGALLIAAGGTVSVTGTLSAKGGDGRARSTYQFDGGGGSGGGLRIVANELAGDGVISALPGVGRSRSGSVGRIRVEYVADSSLLQVTPQPSVVPLASGSSALIWPPADAPNVRILSVGGETVGSDPRASFGTHGADAVIPEASTTEVVVETTNVEEAAEVYVRVTPRTNAKHQFIQALSYTVESTDPLVLHWTADIPVSVGYSALQAKVIRP